MAKPDPKKPAAGKAVEMIFPQDMFYEDLKKPLYLKGKVYVIAPEMVNRWLKRGGVIYEAGKIVQPTVKAAPVAPPISPPVPEKEKEQPEDKGNKPKAE